MARQIAAGDDGKLQNKTYMDPADRRPYSNETLTISLGTKWWTSIPRSSSADSM